MDWQRPTCLGFGLNHATLLGQIYGFVLFCHIMTKVSYGFQMFVYLFRPSFLPSLAGWLAGCFFLSLDLLHTFPKILHPSTIPIHNPNPLAASRLLFAAETWRGFSPPALGYGMDF